MTFHVRVTFNNGLPAQPQPRRVVRVVFYRFSRRRTPSYLSGCFCQMNHAYVISGGLFIPLSSESSFAMYT